MMTAVCGLDSLYSQTHPPDGSHPQRQASATASGHEGVAAPTSPRAPPSGGSGLQAPETPFALHPRSAFVGLQLHGPTVGNQSPCPATVIPQWNRGRGHQTDGGHQCHLLPSCQVRPPARCGSRCGTRCHPCLSVAPQVPPYLQHREAVT